MDNDDKLNDVIQAYTYNMNFVSKSQGVQAFSVED